MTPSGKGAIAFTVMGEDYYPSAGYARIDAAGNVGRDPHRRGGPRARTTGSRATRRSSAIRPAPVGVTTAPPSPTGTSIWIASEYIGQTCTYAQYYPNPPSLANFGCCGGTRTSLANWYTRLTKLDANVAA